MICEVKQVAAGVGADLAAVTSASRSDLLLWLTNRQQPGALEISGPPEVAARWTQLRR